MRKTAQVLIPVRKSSAAPGGWPGPSAMGGPYWSTTKLLVRTVAIALPGTFEAVVATCQLTTDGCTARNYIKHLFGSYSKPHGGLCEDPEAQLPDRATVQDGSD